MCPDVAQRVDDEALGLHTARPHRARRELAQRVICRRLEARPHGVIRPEHLATSVVRYRLVAKDRRVRQEPVARYLRVVVVTERLGQRHGLARQAHKRCQTTCQIVGIAIDVVRYVAERRELTGHSIVGDRIPAHTHSQLRWVGEPHTPAIQVVAVTQSIDVREGGAIRGRDPQGVGLQLPGERIAPLHSRARIHGSSHVPHHIICVRRRIATHSANQTVECVVAVAHRVPAAGATVQQVPGRIIR